MEKPASIIITNYDPAWPDKFNALKQVLHACMNNLVPDIQHVGSTAVPGLAAKPVIDIDLIINDKSFLPEIIKRLKALGYTHQGNLGIEGREAFFRVSSKTPLDGSGRSWPLHNLYCCMENSLSLQNHLQFREYLRRHPEKVTEYSNLKKQLALQYPYDIDAYVAHKTPFITSVLAETGFSTVEISRIAAQNNA